MLREHREVGAHKICKDAAGVSAIENGVAEKSGAYCWLLCAGGIFQLGQCFYPIGIVDVAVMILKGEFRAAVMAVDETLRFSLAENESLSCDCGCFVVANDAVGYKIRFVVEGLGKSAQYMG